MNSRANIHVTIDCSTVLPLVLGVVTRQKPQSMGLWYWELMSHSDLVVLPVGTLHSLEWFWVSRRIFIYSNHNTNVFFFKMSVCLSVCPSVTPFWQCSCHCIIVKFSGIITIDRHDVHAKGQRSKVKVTEVMTLFSCFRTVTPVWIHIWQWNDAQSLMLLRRGILLFFKVIRQIPRSHS